MIKSIKNLREQLNQTLHSSSNQYLCIEQEISKVSIILWLKSQQAQVKMYWSDKDDVIEIAMLGICHQVSTLDDDTRIIETNYYGGMGFDAKTANWQEFGYSRFILPRIEVSRKNSNYKLKCHLDCRHNSVNDEVAACLMILNTLQPEAKLHHQQKHNMMISRKDLPNKSLWAALMSKTLLAEKEKHFSKVVLSRETELHFENKIDSWELLFHWQALNSNCFQFAFQFCEEHTFIGCSPERLYLRSGSRLTTESLAGTTLRGHNESEDLALTNALLLEPKLRRENTLVLEDILSRLEKFSLDVGVDDVAVLKLDRIQHLKQRIHAFLHHDVTDAILLKDLHPTPAVGGSPRDITMQYIVENEPYKRGWYAGAVGYISGEQSEFSVAIRSALVNNNFIKLYAGAGIVQGSEAELEWQELDDKISTILSLLS